MVILKRNLQFALRSALVMVPLLWAFYVLGVFLFLNTPLLQLTTNLNSQDFDLQYRIAWSVIPGLVEIRGATLKIQDDVVDLRFSLPRATALFDLRAFKNKEVHFRNLQIRGLNFHLRLKSAQESKAYPHNPDPRSVTQKRHDNWRARFDEIKIAEIQSLDVDGFVLKGALAIQGGFSLQPGVDVEVGPAELMFKSGSMSVRNPEGGLVPFAENTSGHLRVRFNRFILADNPGAKVLRHLDATAEFQSDIHHVRFFNGFLRHAPAVTMQGGKGHLNADLKVKNGLILHPSRLLVTSPKVEVRALDIAISGKGIVAWDTFINSQSAPQGRLSAKLNSFKMKSSARGQLLLYGNNVTATATSSHLDLTRPFSSLLLQLIIPGAVAPQLSRFYKNVSGTAIAKADIKAFAGAANAQRPAGINGFAHLRFQKALLAVNKNKIRADGDIHFDLSAIDLQRRSGNLDAAKATLHKIALIEQDGKTADYQNPWWISASLDQAKFKFRDFSLFEAQTHISMKDAILPLRAMGLESKLNVLEKFALPKGRFEVGTFLSAAPEFVSAKEIHAQSSGISAQGHLVYDTHGLNGALLVRALNLIAVGVELKNTEMDLSFPASDAWLRSQNKWDEKHEKTAAGLPTAPPSTVLR